MRILITGSRDWDDQALINYVLSAYDMLCNDIDNNYFESITLVSGACPTGADFMCEQQAYNWEWNVERHPADWDRWGKRAGFIRNSEMVNLGADVCLAFIKNQSKGASMTALLAEKAGIETRRFEV